MRYLMIAAVMCGLVGTVMADSMDDAEAKARGVSVEVVLRERVIQQGKRIAELEGQVRELRAVGVVAVPATKPVDTKPAAGPVPVMIIKPRP